MAGLIRLQWWRETLDGLSAGEVRDHPVAHGLKAAWPLLADSRPDLERAIDARERELEERPFGDARALEDHVAATGGTVARAALAACGGQARGLLEAAESVGRAHALMVVLRETHADLGAGRLLLPADASSAGEDVDHGALLAASTLISGRAAAWLGRARRQAGPRSALPALLPGTVVRRRLSRLAKSGCDPLAPDWRRPDPLLPAVLLYRYALGRF